MRRSVVALLMLLVACKSKPKPDPGVVELCVPENDKKVVTVTGYLITPLLTSGCGELCWAHLSDTWEYSALIALDLGLPPGKGPLTMEPIPKDAYNVDSYYFGLTDSDAWRLRVGDLRVVYLVDDDAGVVVILKVARRSESTYRKRDR